MTNVAKLQPDVHITADEYDAVAEEANQLRELKRMIHELASHDMRVEIIPRWTEYLLGDATEPDYYVMIYSGSRVLAGDISKDFTEALERAYKGVFGLRKKETTNE